MRSGGRGVAVGIGGGEAPQAVERRFEVTPQLKRVEALVQRLERGADWRDAALPAGSQIAQTV
jgi:hypothetical protein